MSIALQSKLLPRVQSLSGGVIELSILYSSHVIIACRGVKKTILYQRDHTVQDSLHQVKLWNSAFLFGEDLLEATSSIMSKKPPVFKG